MKSLYDKVSTDCSKLVTKSYSTSFTLGIRLFDRSIRNHIYNIYGFVRLADEIVDSFHDFDKKYLIERFEEDTFLAIEDKISLNPILHSFQDVVHRFDIPKKLIQAFLDSMKMDLTHKQFTQSEYEQYIFGSAEVIGLMCLKIFVNDCDQYKELEPYALKLGSAFQKVNFLRDIKSDYVDRGRVYFPGIKYHAFNNDDKKKIEEDIEEDFKNGLEGIRRLPSNSRKGVFLAYQYYVKLFEKIKSSNYEDILEKRLRISDKNKILLLFKTQLTGVR